MPNRSDRDMEYLVKIDKIPTAVAQQNDSWKVVKDVVHNLIDGQPKKVELSNSVCWCRFQSQDDAVQAYEALTGRSWYDVVSHGNSRGSPKMEVDCLRVHQNGLVEQLCKISQPAQQGRRLSTASHTRTCSTASSSSYIWSPISPSSVSHGLIPPSGHMPQYHPPIPVAVGAFMPASVAPRAENFAFVPAPATVPYGYNVANPVGLAPNPPVYAQASATGPHVARQHSPRPAIQHRQIIVQNLYVGVKERWLKDLFTKSVGPVQECRIEERGDKKRHALVSFTHAEHAQAAVNQFNEKTIEGRKVNVRLTKEVQEGPVIIDGSGVYG